MELLSALLFIPSVLQLVSAGENVVIHNVQGIVGGSAYMRCVLKRPHNVDRLYFQKTVTDINEEFVNGFYSKPLAVRPEYINRTIVNRTELSMEICDLSPADEGEYTCIPFFGSVPYNKTKFHLTVTANYSTPIITAQDCDPGAQNCVISCSSSGGFPRMNVTWGVFGGKTSSLLRADTEPVSIQDPDLLLWNVSHALTVNCSQLLNMLNITCSVGGAVSHAVSVCVPSVSQDFTMPIACAVLLLVSFIVIVIFAVRCRRARLNEEHNLDHLAEAMALK